MTKRVTALSTRPQVKKRKSSPKEKIDLELRL